MKPLTWSWRDGAGTYDSNEHYDDTCASCCCGYPKRCPTCGGIRHGEAARGGDREHSTCCANCGVR